LSAPSATCSDAHPDEAFTTDEMARVCYPQQEIARKHRTAVVCAVKKLPAADPDWKTGWAWQPGDTLIVYNAASVPSTAMLDKMRFGANWKPRAATRGAGPHPRPAA
jgi:hypothetical protein